MTVSHTILITGATGLLGRSILTTFEKQDKFDVKGLGFSRADGVRILKVRSHWVEFFLKNFLNIEKADLTQESDISELFSKCKPNLVIHCAAEKRPDVASQHPEKAQQVIPFSFLFLF